MSLTSSGPTFHPGPLNHATPSNPIHSPALSSPCAPPISCFLSPPSSARLPRPWRKLGPLAEAGCKSPSCTCSSARARGHSAPWPCAPSAAACPPRSGLLPLHLASLGHRPAAWCQSRGWLQVPLDQVPIEVVFDFFFGRRFVNNLMLLLHYSCWCEIYCLYFV